MHNTEYIIWNEKERCCSDCIQKKKKRPKTSDFHCWAIVSYNYKSDLLFYSAAKGGGNITMEDYKQMLKLVLQRRDQVEAEGREFIFQEDNDLGHGTGSQENEARLFKDKHELQ